MIFIFGWGDQKVKKYGPTEERTCQRCNNRTFWQLYSISSWVTLFFIPVFRLKRKHFEQCEICKNSMEVKAEDMDRYIQLAELNQRAASSNMSDADYQTAKSNLGF
jgi:hypothetical protein